MSTHKGAKEKRLKRANALSGQAARPKNARLRQLSRKAATKAKSKRVGAAASPARFKAASAGGIAALELTSCHRSWRGHRGGASAAVYGPW